MASAYGVFANHGLRAEPTPVLKVLDAKGRAIEDNTHPVTTKVLDPGVADTVTDILRGVIQYGTGVAANIGRPAAGKTGTTSDFTNAWFAGYTPTLSTAVWMGYANNQSTRLQNIRYAGGFFGRRRRHAPLGLPGNGRREGRSGGRRGQGTGVSQPGSSG